MRYFTSFDHAIRTIQGMMKSEAVLVPPSFWQSVDVSKHPEMATYEMQNVAFTVGMHMHSQEALATDILPNMPWAEDHFQERVCGHPINPGEQWKHWPFGHSAAKFLDENGQFNHNYMERYWPRRAGAEPTVESGEVLHYDNYGIRHRLGDLNDLIDLFIRDPLTRQGFLPIFFPEDTGSHHGGRVPCTLGYQFIRRNSQLHITYFIRSCDLLRHFKDDIYLTARLNQWVLDNLKQRDPENWDDVGCGTFSMFITSLHMFRNDWSLLYQEAPPRHIGAINEYHERPKARPTDISPGTRAGSPASTSEDPTGT